MSIASPKTPRAYLNKYGPRSYEGTHHFVRDVISILGEFDMYSSSGDYFHRFSIEGDCDAYGIVVFPLSIVALSHRIQGTRQKPRERQ